MHRLRLGAMVVFLIVCLAGGSVLAQDLSLEQAVQTAAENNPAIQAAAAELEAAQAGVKLASAGFWPTLSASGSYGKFDGDVLYGRFLPGADPDTVVPVGEYDTNQVVNLELKQVLYAGGAIGAEKRLRKVESSLADHSLRENRLDLEYRVVRAYFETVLAERRVEVLGRSVERSREGLETIRTRHAEQEALDVELLGAGGKLAADELDLLEADLGLGLARRSLDTLLGRSGDVPLALTTGLDQPLELPPVVDALRRAGESSPAVRQAELLMAQAEAALGGAKARGRPKLELVGLYSWIDNELFFKGDYAAASLNLSIPFFQDVKAGKASKKVAEAHGRQAAHLRQEAGDQIELAVQRGYGQLEVALAGIAVAQHNLEYHAELYRITQSAFREQLATFSEVLDRHDELSKAELALHGAQFEARVAEAEILRMLGD